MELEHFDKYYKHGGTYEVPSSIFEDLIDDRNNYRDRCDIGLNYIDQVLMYSISNFEYKKVYEELDKLAGILSKFGEDCKPDKDLLRIQLSGAETVVKKQEKRIKELERQIKIKDAYCQCIWAIGCDYDGYREAEDLKDIIDELVDYSNKARANDDKSVMSIGWEGNEKIGYNILLEEIWRSADDGKCTIK